VKELADMESVRAKGEFVYKRYKLDRVLEGKKCDSRLRCRYMSFGLDNGLMETYLKNRQCLDPNRYL